MIRIDDVSKSYNGYTVLNKVNMHLLPGQIIGFVGANGSGKSVLLKMICGFIQPDSGKIQVHGKNIGHDCDFPPHTGIMIEEPGFFDAYSARQNLRLFAAHQKKISNQQIDTLIQSVGLNPLDKKPVGKYSMGMRQRLCFAQAIMEEPDLLILDEPFITIDKQWSEWMRSQVRSYASPNRLIILTIHYQDNINALCTCTYHFEDGQVNLVKSD